jgi:archaeoflavoprotein AfpA
VNVTDKLRVAWGITGAGDYLVESMEAMRNLRRDFGAEITVILSKDGELVVKWYGLWKELNEDFDKVKSERGPNVPFIAGPLQLGHYAFLFISPATANTSAKIAYGIADSLITNSVAQTIKGGTPVYIYPVDQKPGSQLTEGPKGEQITITTRQIDLENVDRLRKMEGITVLGHPSEIEAAVRALRIEEDRQK